MKPDASRSCVPHMRRAYAGSIMLVCDLSMMHGRTHWDGLTQNPLNLSRYLSLVNARGGRQR